MNAPALTLVFEEVDPWALPALLRIVSRAAHRHSVVKVGASCDLIVKMEVTEESDLEAFERELNTRWIHFGKGVKK